MVNDTCVSQYSRVHEVGMAPVSFSSVSSETKIGQEHNECLLSRLKKVWTNAKRMTLVQVLFLFPSPSALLSPPVLPIQTLIDNRRGTSAAFSVSD